MPSKKRKSIYRKRVEYSDLLAELNAQSARRNNIPNSHTIQAATYQPSPFRQRILSDERIKYLYDIEDNIIHDKSCKLARSIPDERLLYGDRYDNTKQKCPECAVTAFLREGAKDFDSVKKYTELFEQMHLHDGIAREIYIEKKMKTRAGTDGITIWYREDSWKIKPVDRQGNVQLWHNNYRQLAEGKREFLAGYHLQFTNTESTSLRIALNTIETYSYESHIQNQYQGMDPVVEENTNVLSETDMQSDTPLVWSSETPVPGQEQTFSIPNKITKQPPSLWKRFTRWLRLLFTKSRFFRRNSTTE